MVGLLVAAALAAATPAVAESRPEAAPAIFVVGDADTTVYLFGTFHALDGKSDWFNNRVRGGLAYDPRKHRLRDNRLEHELVGLVEGLPDPIVEPVRLPVEGMERSE